MVTAHSTVLSSGAPPWVGVRRSGARNTSANHPAHGSAAQVVGVDEPTVVVVVVPGVGVVDVVELPEDDPGVVVATPDPDPDGNAGAVVVVAATPVSGLTHP